MTEVRPAHMIFRSDEEHAIVPNIALNLNTRDATMLFYERVN